MISNDGDCTNTFMIFPFHSDLFFAVFLILTSHSAFNKLHACMRDAIEPKCGSEAYEMQRQFMRTSLSRLPSITCSKYEQNSKTCGNLLPPAGSQPKGAKSHSVLSKLFSAYTGQ